MQKDGERLELSEQRTSRFSCFQGLNMCVPHTHEYHSWGQHVSSQQQDYTQSVKLESWQPVKWSWNKTSGFNRTQGSFSFTESQLPFMQGFRTLQKRICPWAQITLLWCSRRHRTEWATFFFFLLILFENNHWSRTFSKLIISVDHNICCCLACQVYKHSAHW